MTIVLGVDLATADVRVQAFDVETGRALAARRSPLEVTGTAGRRTQPARYGDLARGLIAAVASDLGARAREVRALSVTGTSGTVVPVDAKGTPVSDAVLYDDPRGEPELRLLTAAGVGVRPSAALARAAWMHAALPAAHYVFTPDVVAAALAGRLLPSDTSHALKSGIDPVAATWSDAALDAVGLPADVMPQLVGSGRIIGEVAFASALGLPAGVAIVSGMTDGSTGQLATGAVAEGDTVGVLGTTLVLKAVSTRDVVDGSAGIYSHVAPDGLFWAGGASNTGAGVLRSGPTAGWDPAEHTPAIEAVGPSDAVSYPLARAGERFPVSSTDFAGFIVDLAGTPRDQSDPIARFRTIYEGVAFVERMGLERLRELGVGEGRHHVAGGAAASELWNRIRASALGRSVTVSAGAGSGRGAAVLAAYAIGSETLAAVAQRFAGSRSEVEPDAALTESLEQRYRVFRAALAAAL
ncbi:FGGY-family carbohydrate kinase [soil metagenome]